jgi:hypothetical protein
MNVTDTLVGRLKKLLRVKFQIKTSSVTEDTALGESPIGFDDAFIQSEFRIQLSDWFEDILKPFPAVDWDGSTTLSDLADAIVGACTIRDINKAAVFRAHVLDLATTAFNDAAGSDAQSVPIASRPGVRNRMNKDLTTSLLRDLSLDDLAGDRDTILSNVTDRMMI